MKKIITLLLCSVLAMGLFGCNKVPEVNVPLEEGTVYYADIVIADYGTITVNGEKFSRKGLYVTMVKYVTPVMLLFLLLPAINLSGMVSNRMEGRLAEMGVRKAFGANRGVLLRQVIQENLVLTLLGGLAGYVLSWLIIAAIRNHPMFLAMFERDGEPVHQVSLQLDMFLSPSMFLIAFVCCAVLNLMAALMPAWKSLKKPIVESLNPFAYPSFNVAFPLV